MIADADKQRLFDQILDEDYCRFVLPIVQRRLAQAGVRLAAILNEILK